MSESPILQVIDLRKSFGGVNALRKVSFELHAGEILGIIGPNGSGKTTLINTITGFVKSDAGRVLFKGKDITGEAPHKIVMRGLARTFQIPRPYYSLPAYENLMVPLYSPKARKFSGGGKLGDRAAVAIDVLEEVGFERDAHVPYKAASSLPTGYLKRLELARCITLRPEVIIADELFSGLTIAEAGSLIPLIERLRMDGFTFILVEHRLKELFKLTNRVLALNFGEKLAEGSPEEVMENEEVKKAYLGWEV